MNAKTLLTISAACFVTAVIASTATALFTCGMNKAQADPIQDKTLKAEGFDLVDSKGDLRGSFSVGKKSGLPQLSLWDDQGNIRAVIGVAKDGSPSFSMLDDKGKSRVGISLTKGGNGTISLLDGKGEIRGMFSMTDKGDTAMFRYDEKGKLIEK